MAGSMTKSALNLARLSLKVTQASLPAYAHKFSLNRYTQHQLFSILVLRQFFKTDYRGMVVLLAEWSELRSTLGLKHVPNYSTLCYAEQRLITQPVFEHLLQQTIQQAQAQQVIEGPLRCSRRCHRLRNPSCVALLHKTARPQAPKSLCLAQTIAGVPSGLSPICRRGGQPRP